MTADDLISRLRWLVEHWDKRGLEIAARCDKEIKDSVFKKKVEGYMPSYLEANAYRTASLTLLRIIDEHEGKNCE